MSDIENLEMIVEEPTEVADEPIFECKDEPTKKKRTRAPMSEERKEALREQLKVARDKKKALKEAGKEPIKVVKEKTVKEVVKVEEPVKPTKPVKQKVIKEVVNEPIVDSETDDLKKELAQMKKQKADEATAKAEKKAVAAAKRKATIERKALEKKLSENVVAKAATRPRPATPVPVEVASVEPVKARYSTYKKSIWTDFM